MLLPAPEDMPAGDLPVRAVLAEVTRALRHGGRAVLVAPPGTGKTTLVPLALADALPGRILVAEPRRVAARAAARRMSTLVGDRVGGLIGYRVRGDRRVSAATRVEVVTTGVLVQRMQRDPELPGVGAVVIDECHERHLDTDLALAFTVDVRRNLRDDLPVLAASATAQADRLAAALGPGTPVVTATAATHPLDVRWAPPPTPITPPHGLRVDPRLLDHVAATIRTALRDRDGDVLAFLPGMGEISRTASRLSGLDDIELLTLHGSQSAAAQDAALTPGARRRIVLASAVAESSITVPGVRIVVDAGLAREPRVDHARGLGALVTVRESRASAEQRAGRAAREAPGTVYRCWTEADHARLAPFPRPEVATADLTSFVLQLARWGAADGAGLELLDAMPSGAFLTAVDTLRAVGALTDLNRITDRGGRLATVGVHPRLARALLDGARLVGRRRAAETVALLSADVSPRGDDLVRELRALRTGDRRDAGAWRSEVRRLTDAVPDARGDRRPDDLAAATVAALAYPERIARRRTGDAEDYLMVSGTAARLADGSALSGSEWLVVADADRQPGRSEARVRLAAVLDEETARAVAPRQTTEDEIAWRDGDVVARRETRLGAVVVGSRRLVDPDPERIAAALADGIRREGLALLRFGDAARELRDRIAVCRHVFGDPWPEVSDAALAAEPMTWLEPELLTARRRADLARVSVAGALRRMLSWRQAADLDRLVPQRMEVPTGSRPRIDYSDPAAPVLAVKLQECFGWTATPTVADGRLPVVLHLLSPAGRPVAVTADLESFWHNGYRQVRAELRGRYPKHPWPEDPWSATPTRYTKRRGG